MMTRKDFDDVSTVLSAPRGPSQAIVQRFLLTVVDGPDRGTVFHVDGAQPSRAYGGKGPLCQMRVTDPRVSRRHLALDVVEAGLRVQDVGSTNGSLVNGLTVVDVILRGGELLRIGDTTLRIDPDTPATAEMSGATNFGRVIG